MFFDVAGVKQSDYKNAPGRPPRRVRMLKSVSVKFLDGSVGEGGPAGTEHDIGADLADELALSNQAEILGEVVGGTLREIPVAALPKGEPTAPAKSALRGDFGLAADAVAHRDYLRRKRQWWQVEYDGEPIINGRRVRNPMVAERLNSARRDENDLDPVAAERLLLKCSRQLWDAIAEQTAVVRELRAVARQIFALRCAPLDLCDAKLTELFYGSAVYWRFVRTDPDLDGLKSAPNAAGGTDHFFDDDPETLAHRHGLSVARKAEAEMLLVQARAELANVKRALSKQAA